MEVYKDFFVDQNELNSENSIAYFKDPVARTRSKYEDSLNTIE